MLKPVDVDEIAHRLDRIEGLLRDLTQTTRERRMLVAIARETQGAVFSVRELLSLSRKTPRVAVETPGWSSRSIGRLLARSVGSGGPIEVQRVGMEAGSTLWVCCAKPRDPMDDDTFAADYAGATNDD